MNASAFRALGVAEPLVHALTDLGFNTPTPIQKETIPPILDGRDLVGIAQTGTGKTAAFGLPIIQHLVAENRRPPRAGTRALILAPTRELALQINDSLRQLARHLPLRTAVILGGVGRRPQVNQLARGVDIVVGTPGRVLDLLQTDELRIGAATHFVLDEADRMLDLGFIRDIRLIVAKLPKQRQSLMFSATMPEAVASLADSILSRPLRVHVSPEKPTADRIDQRVYFVAHANKRDLLSQVLKDQSISRAIVFTRTKHAASRVAEYLCRGGTQAEALHGNKSQAARQQSLERFRSGRARILVATDIAARGIDVAAVSHVINFDMPNVAEGYVHRIGRTARAGAAGVALSFCDASEAAYLRGIEKLTGAALSVVGGIAPFAHAAAGRREPTRRPQEARPRRRLRRAA